MSLIRRMAPKGVGRTFRKIRASLSRRVPGALIYRCNICGSQCQTPMMELARETPSCTVCGSTPRYRAMIRALSEELFGKSLALPDFPIRRDLAGLGLSDWDGYAGRLAQKFSYINTFLHQPPFLDITTGDSARRESLDFLISSEVFEHVAPPVSAAFCNARELLRPAGVLILSVPYTLAQDTTEHFPNLYRYNIKMKTGRQVLENVDRSGKREEYDQLIFHEGHGVSLEMRVFSENSLLEQLRSAGFDSVKIYREPDYAHGVFWKESWSLPMAARSTRNALLGR